MSFSAQIEKFCDVTKKRLQKTRRGVTIELFSAVIMDTPVLDGYLRGAWRMTEKTPSSETPGTTDESGMATVAAMQQGVLVSTGEVDVFLTNNLPYGPRIEFDGWSHTKAPEGMVRRNVVRFNGLIEVEAAKAKQEIK